MYAMFNVEIGYKLSLPTCTRLSVKFLCSRISLTKIISINEMFYGNSQWLPHWDMVAWKLEKPFAPCWVLHLHLYHITVFVVAAQTRCFFPPLTCIHVYTKIPRVERVCSSGPSGELPGASVGRNSIYGWWISSHEYLSGGQYPALNDVYLGRYIRNLVDTGILWSWTPPPSTLHAGRATSSLGEIGTYEWRSSGETRDLRLLNLIMIVSECSAYFF